MLATLLATVLPALIPVGIDGVRAIINRVTGGAGAQPANAQEVIALMQAETAKLEALAKMDCQAGASSQWVNNIVRLQRPVAVIGILTTYVLGLTGLGILPDEAVNIAGNLASSVVFYLFGDRTLMYFKRGK